MFVRLLSLLAAILAIGAEAAAPSQWEWVAPQPHRQTWVDVTAGPAGFVGLTDGAGGRKIYHSPNGEQWELAVCPTTADLRRVVFANGHYLALGASATILSSIDGIDWQIRHTDASTGWLFDIAYGHGVYVAVGYNSISYYSKDLKTWTPLEFSPGYSLLNVEFGNGLFLAVANIGKAYKSYDGRVWTSVEWPASVGPGDWSTYEAGLAFSKGKFVLSMSGGTASSADGENWTPCVPNFFRKICTSEDGFLGITGSSLATSADGLTWNTAVTLPDWNSQFFGAAISNGRWLAVGYGGLIYRSSNGAEWEAALQPIDYSRGKIAFANGAFIRYGDEPGIFVSSDGSNWTFNADAPAFTTISGGNGVCVGITDEGAAAVSSDAIHWSAAALPSAPYGDLLFGKGTFVIATDGGVLVSADGKSWDSISVSNVESIRLIGFQNNIFAALSNSSQPMTSSDGRTWTVHAPRPDLSSQFFAAGNGRFVGIGGSGMGHGVVVWSTDGANWQREQLNTGSTHGYTGFAFGGGYFVMIDGSGSLFHSPDGTIWSGQRQAAQPFTGAAYGNGAWVVVGGDSILRSAAPMTARSAAALQLTHTNFTTWNLIVTGSPGERWQIQSAATVTSDWTTLQSIEIPVTGAVSVPLPGNPTAAFFRAVIQP